MTERSWPWPGVTVGDAGTYNADEWDDMFEMRFGSGAAPYANRGVIRNWANELEVTDPVVAGRVDVDTGAALVHGKHYDNDAVVNVVGIPVSGAPWREDTIFLRQDWVTQTTRIYRHQNSADGAGYETPASTDGIVWYIPLAAVRIDAGGVILQITDLRDYVSDLMQPKQLQVLPWPEDGVEAGYHYHHGVELDPLNDDCGFEFMVPLDFKELVEVFIRFIPLTTGSVTWLVTMRAGACGESDEAVSDSTTDTEAVTADTIECLDVTAGFQGLAAGDEVGIDFRNVQIAGDETIIVLLLDFRYK